MSLSKRLFVAIAANGVAVAGSMAFAQEPPGLADFMNRPLPAGTDTDIDKGTYFGCTSDFHLVSMEAWIYAEGPTNIRGYTAQSRYSAVADTLTNTLHPELQGGFELAVSRMTYAEFTSSASTSGGEDLPAGKLGNYLGGSFNDAIVSYDRALDRRFGVDFYAAPYSVSFSGAPVADRSLCRPAVS